jgi:hypothetical protein
LRGGWQQDYADFALWGDNLAVVSQVRPYPAQQPSAISALALCSGKQRTMHW